MTLPDTLRKRFKS